MMSPERIIDAARRMIEADGVEALSMRKLAAELGVAPTAIYWHVGGRDDLLRAVLDQLIREAPPIRARGSTSRARVASVARAIRRQVRDNPVMFQLAQHLDRNPDVSFPWQMALAREVAASGLRGTAAADAVRAVLFLVGGFQLLEGNLRRRPAGSTTTQDLWSAVDDQAIDPALRDAMASALDHDALFDYALDALLRSVLP
ncbi:MAG TPA: TetR/AcrR family transcriptional regulator [Acidimicrobiales bacterium]